MIPARRNTATANDVADASTRPRLALSIASHSPTSVGLIEQIRNYHRGPCLMHIENRLESFMFAGRWLLAPFYLGLLLALGLLLVKFVKEFIEFAPMVFTSSGADVIVALLSLIDVVLVANLLVIIVYAGYENFVSRMHIGEHEDRPSWMGQVGFSELKMKLIGSIVAISAIELLRAFMSTEEMTGEQIGWKLAVHIGLVFSGLLFAIMDRIAEGTKQVEVLQTTERP
jgi:uncharacterized protein (TIGR00645 family)